MVFSALPKLIEIEPTYSCNLRCRMCHVSFMPNESRPVFPAELTEKLSGLAGTHVIIGSGFEPTMNKGFGQIIRALTRIGMPIEMITNGSLLDDELISIMADAPIRLITFSFDGISRETYEHIRRRAKFDEVVANILKAKQRLGRDAHFVINTTIMRSNLHEVGKTVEFWDRADFDLLRIITMVVRYNEPSLVAESLYPVRDEFNAALDDAARDVIESKRRIIISTPHFNRSALKKEYPNNFSGSHVISDNPDTRRVFEPRSSYQLGAGPEMSWPCQSPWTFARITPNADVELCFKYAVGNLRDRSFEDIWFGPEATKVREKVATDLSICPACDHYRFCLNSGTVDPDDRNSYLTHDLLASPPDFGAIAD